MAKAGRQAATEAASEPANGDGVLFLVYQQQKIGEARLAARIQAALDMKLAELAEQLRETRGQNDETIDEYGNEVP